MIEIWKSIPDYEGLYEVSNTGFIKTLSRKVQYGVAFRIQPERIMTTEKIRKGHLRVTLSKQGETKRILVHRIVYIVFKGEIQDELVVNHKDRNKENNHIDNLELMTNRDNTHHFRNTIKRDLPLGVSKYRSKYKAVINVSKKSYHLGSFKTPEEASQVYQKALHKLQNAL
jgi:hypothetical protein